MQVKFLQSVQNISTTLLLLELCVTWEVPTRVKKYLISSKSVQLELSKTQSELIIEIRTSESMHCYRSEFGHKNSHEIHDQKLDNPIK